MTPFSLTCVENTYGTIIQCCFIIGQASKRLGQHWLNGTFLPGYTEDPVLGSVGPASLDDLSALNQQSAA